MINYQLQLPKKMGLKLLYPRRRGLVFKILAFCTFIGFVGLWFKNEPLEEESAGPNHILDRALTHKPAGQVVQPIDDQIIRVDDLPNLLKEAPKNKIIQAPAKRRNLPSNEDMIERMKADRLFAEDEAKVVRGLGEAGRPVRLTGEEGRRAEEVMKKEAFNLVASDKISPNRTVPDSRDPLFDHMSNKGSAYEHCGITRPSTTAEIGGNSQTHEAPVETHGNSRNTRQQTNTIGTSQKHKMAPVKSQRHCVGAVLILVTGKTHYAA